MKMNRTILLVAAAGLGCSAFAAPATPAEKALADRLPEVFERSRLQYKRLIADMKGQEGLSPRCYENGRVIAVKPHDWCSGFFAGGLWYLYEYTRDDEMKAAAERYTANLEAVRHYTGNHDLGFMLMTSVGNGLRLAPKPEYRQILLDGAAALCKRHSPKLGLIRSWGNRNGKTNFLVIIDNLVNLELLEWAAKNGGEARFAEISASHADITDRNHFRPDGSAYHVLNYNQQTGKILEIRAGQGACVSGTWSRGHSWAIYGYTMMFRETKNQKYLDRAVKSADYALSVPTLTADKIPYWDYKAPEIPNEERDASAAAVMASALLELSCLVPGEKGARYRAFAVDQLTSLVSDAYFSRPGENGNFLLMHSTGAKPSWYGNKKAGSVDVPMIFADYYFLEALVRFRSLLDGCDRFGMEAPPLKPAGEAK